MAAQITQAEINELKSQFESKIGNYSIVFKKNEEGKEIFQVYDGESGEDAFWAGSIVLEQDYYIDWEFSLKNGATISKAAFKINENNKGIVNTIYDIYQIFSDNLNKYIRTDGESSGMEAETSGEEIISGGEETEEPETIAESRTIKSRKNIIDSSSDRMKRLAGL
jgi:hypothetical protein